MELPFPHKPRCEFTSSLLSYTNQCVFVAIHHHLNSILLKHKPVNTRPAALHIAIMPLQSAKEKFNAAVDSTRNSEGGVCLECLRPFSSTNYRQRNHKLLTFSSTDAKGPPLKVANPSTDDASISNKFVIPGRTAEAHPDTIDAQQKAGSHHTSFFKGNTS